MAASGAVGVVAVVLGAILLVQAPGNGPAPPGSVCPQAVSTHRCAVILTASGTVVFEVEETFAPRTSSHFIALFESGYYSGLPWHRVEDWVIQTGQGTAVGNINLETHPSLKNVRGAVAVARTDDPNSGSSQFYILRNDASHLDGGYAVFGTVRQGMDVVDAIALNEVISGIQVVDHYPL